MRALTHTLLFSEILQVRRKSRLSDNCYVILSSYRDGEYAWDFNERTADKIVEFMKE